jgi:hypothetical protein
MGIQRTFRFSNDDINFEKLDLIHKVQASQIKTPR